MTETGQGEGHQHEDGVVLCPQCTGTWLVVTASHSGYLLDLDTGTATRVPDPDRIEEWLSLGGKRMPVAPLPEGLVNQTPGLRRDGESIPLLGLAPVVLGERAALLLDLVGGDAIGTTRTTNDVVEVRRLDPSPENGTGDGGAS